MTPSEKSVAILMCTYNGERFLEEQLASFVKQTHGNWELWVSDDGSEDRTLQILDDFSREYPGRVRSVYRGPSCSHAANFQSLLLRREIIADYYAFSDQDDVWNENKLERALHALDASDNETPCLYCSRTLIVNEYNQEIGLSPLFEKPPSFGNALVQSIAGGNTMVFNNSTRQLLAICEPTVPVSHDWWAYIVVTGCAGWVFYDPSPSLRYRQHATNVIGVNSSWAGRISRCRMLLEGRFRRWNDTNLEALRSLLSYLSPKSRQILEEFSDAREASLFPRLIKLRRCGIYRQTWFGDLSLIGAAILRKI